MSQLVKLIIFFILLPLEIGFSLSRKIENKIQIDFFNLWSLGLFVELGVFGLAWKYSIDRGNKLSTNYAYLFMFIFLIVAIVKFFIYEQKKIGLSIKKYIPKTEHLVIICLLYFVINITEDTIYQTDQVESILSKGIGKSLYSYVISLTSIKQEKLIFFVFPLIFLLFSYKVYSLIFENLKIRESERIIFMGVLFTFYLLPLWRDEWDGYNLFGMLWDTWTFVSCIYAPLVLLWIIRCISIFMNKSNLITEIFNCIFSAIILFGIGAMCQILNHPIIRTPLNKSINTNKDILLVVRDILHIYGINRFNFTIIFVLLFVLFYIKDNRKNSFVWVITIMMFIYFIPLVAERVISSLGVEVYALMPIFWQLPILFAYTASRISEECKSTRKKIIAISTMFIILIIVCTFNYDNWGQCMMFTRRGQ